MAYGGGRLLLRVLSRGVELCEVAVTEPMIRSSALIMTISETHGAIEGSANVVVDMSIPPGTQAPTTRVIPSFFTFLSENNAVASTELLLETAGLLDVADYLGLQTENIFNEARWFGANRTDGPALRARMHLKRHAICVAFATTMVPKWFFHFPTANTICFVPQPAVPNYDFPNRLVPNEHHDGRSFTFGMDGDFKYIPLVACGRLPPTPEPHGETEEAGAGDRQRLEMTHLYLACGDQGGRDLLHRTISNAGYDVRALPFADVTRSTQFTGEAFAQTAYLVSLTPRPVDRFRGRGSNEDYRGRRAHQQARDQSRYSRSRSRSPFHN